MSTVNPPRVSVIIPVRNEERYLGACLRSLLRGSYPPDRWEIIVVDGMSDDHTARVIARVARETTVPITVISNPRRITPVALNLGLAHASGDIIMRVDAHSEYDDDYVARCVRVSRETQAANVGGPIETRPGADTPTARAIAMVLSHPFGVGNSAFRTQGHTPGAGDATAREADTVPFGCFRADIFRAIGLFDERLHRHQDFDLNQRIRRAGGRIVLDSRLQCLYYARPRLLGLLRQGWSTGFWNAMANHLNPANRCFRHLVPAAFVLNLLFALAMIGPAVAGRLPVWLWVPAGPSLAGLLLYLLLDVIVCTRLAARRGWRCWPHLLITFPAYHITYGAGIIWGWLRIAGRRFPWRAEDGIPRWDDVRATAGTRKMAA